MPLFGNWLCKMELNQSTPGIILQFAQYCPTFSGVIALSGPRRSVEFLHNPGQSQPLPVLTFCADPGEWPTSFVFFAEPSRSLRLRCTLIGRARLRFLQHVGISDQRTPTALPRGKPVNQVASSSANFAVP